MSQGNISPKDIRVFPASTEAALASKLPTTPANDTEKDGEGGPADLPSSPPLATAGSEHAEGSPLSPPLPEPAEFVADGVFFPAPKRNLVIAALEQHGDYLRDLGSGRHAVKCPWTNEHQDGAIGEAIYTEPTRSAPNGQYHCPCQHGEKPDIVRLLDRLEIEPQRARGKPCIRVEVGEQNLVLDAAEYVLSSHENIFLSDGSIVAISGQGGSDVAVALLGEQALSLLLAEVADWQRYDGRSKAYVRSDPPLRICQSLLRGRTYRYLRQLKGVARQPFFRKPDGELMLRPGYDPRSGIYARFDADAFTLPEPTREAAEAALARLKGLLGEFHFASEADRSAALCAILTATVRSSLPLAPAFNVTASTPGTGKSYLTSVITPFAGPAEPFNMSYPATSEEASKAMLAALIPAPAVIAFDDMQTDWTPHSVINRMLTSETISERLLGSSRIVTARTATFFVGTGNNVGPVRDMCRRVVSLRLNAPPSGFAYQGNPVAAVRANRETFVSAALTIIRGWYAAGKPEMDVPTIGSFGEWSNMCRQPLLWLGMTDPATSLMEQVRNDPDLLSLTAFMEAMTYEFGDKPVTVRKIMKAAGDNPDGALAEALMELPVSDRQLVNPSKLGWYLKKNAERVVEGYMIRKVETPERRAWAVVKAA